MMGTVYSDVKVENQYDSQPRYIKRMIIRLFPKAPRIVSKKCFHQPECFYQTQICLPSSCLTIALKTSLNKTPCTILSCFLQRKIQLLVVILYLNICHQCYKHGRRITLIKIFLFVRSKFILNCRQVFFSFFDIKVNCQSGCALKKLQMIKQQMQCNLVQSNMLPFESKCWGTFRRYFFSRKNVKN